MISSGHLLFLSASFLFPGNFFIICLGETIVAATVFSSNNTELKVPQYFKVASVVITTFFIQLQYFDAGSGNVYYYDTIFKMLTLDSCFYSLSYRCGDPRLRIAGVVSKYVVEIVSLPFVSLYLLHWDFIRILYSGTSWIVESRSQSIFRSFFQLFYSDETILGPRKYMAYISVMFFYWRVNIAHDSPSK